MNPEARSLITFFSKFIFLVRDSAVDTAGSSDVLRANTYSRHYRYLIIGGKTAMLRLLPTSTMAIASDFTVQSRRLKTVYRNPLKNSTSNISRTLIRRTSSDTRKGRASERMLSRILSLSLSSPSLYLTGGEMRSESYIMYNADIHPGTERLGIFPWLK